MRGWRRLCIAVAGVWTGLSIVGNASVLAGAQAPLDPNGFASLGSLTGATSYVFDTSAVTLTEDGGPAIHGALFNGVAVFDFSSITLSTGSTLTASGSLPLAILSRGTAVFAGSVNARAQGADAGPGGYSGGTNGIGTGPGGTQSSPLQSGDGAGFGGLGGPNSTHRTSALGGETYSDPTHVFLGGSGGAGASPAVPGGGGGGALEISAARAISPSADRESSTTAAMALRGMSAVAAAAVEDYSWRRPGRSASRQISWLTVEVALMEQPSLRAQEGAGGFSLSQAPSLT